MVNTEHALLLNLYAGPADPARWSDALSQLCQVTGAASAAIQVIRQSRSDFAIEWMAVDTLTQGRQQLLPPGIADEGNPRWERHRIARTVGRIVRDDDLFERHEQAGQRLQGQLAELGIGRFLGSLQALDSDTFMGVALHRESRDTSDYSPLQVRRLAALLPHFNQAFRLRRQLRSVAEPDRRLRDHLDRLQGALLICNSDGGIDWMNRRAQDLLASSVLLRAMGSGPGRRLAATAHADQLRLQQEIQAAALMPDSSRYLAIGQGSGRLHVALQASSAMAAAPDGSVLLVISSAGEAAAVSASAIARLFGLTQAESRLAAALAAGCSLEQYAGQQGVSAGTVRCQVKQVFAKTGTARQSELVRLVLSSPAAQVIDSVTPH